MDATFALFHAISTVAGGVGALGWVDHAFKMGRKSPFTLLPKMRRSTSLDQKAKLHQAIYPGWLDL